MPVTVVKLSSLIQLKINFKKQNKFIKAKKHTFCICNTAWTRSNGVRVASVRPAKQPDRPVIRRFLCFEFIDLTYGEFELLQ